MRNNREDWEYRQGRSPRQVEDTWWIVYHLYTVGGLGLLGIIVYNILT
jgi:hypothetical protein